MGKCKCRLCTCEKKNKILKKEDEKDIRNADELWYNQIWYDAMDAFDFCEEECCKTKETG